MITLWSAALFLVGHLLTPAGEVRPVGRAHYWTHALYAWIEPLVIKTADFMVSRSLITGNPLGRLALRFMAWSNLLLPHGVVIPTAAAARILRDIAAAPDSDAHIAVGPCVCQKQLDRYCEPIEKDMTIMYGAEIYRRFHDDYRVLELPEALAMLKQYHERGLTPVAEFLMQSGRWMFVLCHCDREVCCPTRIYNAIGHSLYPGPYRVRQNVEKCLGEAACGKCIGRCNFFANRSEGGKVLLDMKKCLGCGLCVTTCSGGARRLERRPDYSGRLLPFDRVKTPEIPTD